MRYLQVMRMWLFAGLGSLLTVLGISIPLLWALAPLGLAFFLYSVWSHTPSRTHAALTGLVYGTVISAAGIWSFWDAIPLAWLGVYDPLIEIAAVGSTWLYISIGLGVAVALVSPLLWLIRRSVIAPLVGAILWVLAEQLRMWCFALLTWAPQSLLGPHFSAPSLGYALTENPYLLQLAHPLGIDALNFVIALLAGVLVVSVRVQKDKTERPRLFIASAMLGVVMLVPALSTYQAPVSTTTKHIAILATDVPAGEPYQTVHKLLAQAVQGATLPDIVLIPEAIGLNRIFHSQKEQDEFIKRTFGEKETLILHSGYAPFKDESTAGKGVERLVYESTTHGVLATFDKVFLMPIGEYVPSLLQYFYTALGNPALGTYVEKIEDANTRGTELQSFTYDGVTIGAMLCSELLSPSLYARMVREENATLLVNLSNLSWFHGSHLLHQKMVQIAKVHAVESRRYLLAAVNEAPSFVLDPSGAVIAESTWDTETILFVDIPTP